MGQVTELAREIVAATEIFFLGKSEQQYNNATFILCDDYAEIASKLFLIQDNPRWSGADVGKMNDYNEARKKVRQAAQRKETADQAWLDIFDRGEPRDAMKQFHTVLGDVENVFNQKRIPDLPLFTRLATELKRRHTLRNDIFHSPNPLGTRVSSETCVLALCDLLEYAKLLFGQEWQSTEDAVGRLQTWTLLLRLERKAMQDRTVRDKINALLAKRPRYSSSSAKKGVHTVKHEHDVHRHLCVVYDEDKTFHRALDNLSVTLGC